MSNSMKRTSRSLIHRYYQLPFLTGLVALPAFSAAFTGPEPQVPAGGGPPGPYPNASVSGVNVIAKGSSVFNSNVEVTGLEGQGPIPWSVNRYNRGDFAMRISPGDPAAALGNLNQGFIEYGDGSEGVAASQAWRAGRLGGICLPTPRQNGPIDWGDGEGPFYPTVAVSWASSGPGYSLLDGSWGNGDLDVNTGRAGTHGSSPEANFSFSTVWLPYDQGWLGGDVAGPSDTGASSWTSPGAHSVGLSAGMIRWVGAPPDSGTYSGQAELRLPGVNSLEDGMIFTTSSDGSSDVNIVGVAPLEDGSGWLVSIREDSEVVAEMVVNSNESEFQFVYVPFNAERLVGGYINGSNGSKLQAAGDFTITRTGAGTYQMTIPGKAAADGTLLLQAAEYEAGTWTPVATRAFMSYEFSNGNFVIQARKTTSATTADLADVNFYVAWVDFAEPMSPPAGPRVHGFPTARVSAEGLSARECSVAASTNEPELLVTYIDPDNVGTFVDPISGLWPQGVMTGRFYDATTLQPTSDPFIVFGNPDGQLSRNDVKYNPVSKQYVVVSNARGLGGGSDVALVALVNPASVAGENSPVAKAWVNDPGSDQSYDDVSVAVSSKNGNFLLACERKAAGEGESTVGVLYDQNGARLTPPYTRVDLLQSIGDEDDPDVIYHEDLDAFLYISNTDNSNGSTGTLSNRIVGSLVGTVPDGQGQLVVGPEQPLGDGLPEGRAEGHPAAVVNPSNGELIVAYDAGNGTAQGDLAYVTIGVAPETFDFSFTPSMPEVPYLDGADGDPFNHQHPQLAADPVSGVIAVGMNATGSALGIPDAYAFVLLGPDGLPLPSQLGAPYFLADSPGGLGNSANYHQLRYSPVSESFVAVFSSGAGVTYLASFAVLPSEVGPVEPPPLAITRDSGGIMITWPASASGFDLQSTGTLSPADWQSSGLTPTVEGDQSKVTVTPEAAAQFYRLSHP